MNAPEHSKPNRRLGLILCLLFVGLFIIVTATIVTGSKAPLGVGTFVDGLIAPVLGIIGMLLIVAAVGEIVQNRRVTIILSVILGVAFVLSTFVKGFNRAILGVTLLLLIVASVVEIVLRIVKNRVRE